MSYQDAAVEARQEADNMASTSHNMAMYEPEDLKEITGDYTHVLGRDEALYKQEEEALDTEAALDQELCAFRGSSQGTKSIYQDAAEARQEADNMASMSHNMATYGPEELKEITGNYTHVLGRGGYGVVYKGTCKDGKEIALKVLHERPGDKMDTEFNSELELIRKLVHKNIIRLVGYCYKKESEYNSARGAALCFEYAPNGSLRRYISDGDDGPDWCMRYSIIKGICEGLRYLHHHPSGCFIYHLDLKPENILLGDDMVPKIADFGLSRLYSDHATRITGSNRAVTVRYAPHEFRLKGIRSTTFDIYSLGVLIIEIVGGPETYDKTYDTEKEEIIEHVCKRWISKLDETHLHQVRRCLEIALRCSDTVRRNRPEISNVIQELFDPENMITIEKSVCQESIGNQGSGTGKVDSGAIWHCMGTNPSRSPGMSTPKVKRRVGKYELGLTIGKGTFGKVNFAMNVETAEAVAIKILDKEKLLEHKMVGQVEQAIATMKLIKHPNVVHIHEVMGSKTKIYIVLELVNGGELFDKIISDILLSVSNLSTFVICSSSIQTVLLDIIVNHVLMVILLPVKNVNYGRMSEDEARRCFQQLINAVDYCHSRGVYHRNLKPESLLLDNRGNLKVSDFWSSALPHQLKGVGLLHTTCGTPNYVAPEVLEDQGYDGAMADFWSCGVILFVLLAGYLPFEDSNITALYKKISNAQFTCPPWTSFPAKRLLTRILDPNPMTRITIQEIFEDEWFKKGYEHPQFDERYCITLDDVDAAFNDLGEHHETEQKEEPVALNAFELISMSAGLDLGNFFNCELDF